MKRTGMKVFVVRFTPTFPLSPLVPPCQFGKHLLLRSSQYRDITGLPEWKREEACLVIATSKNEERTVRRPPDRNVGFAVLVIIPRHGSIAVLPERDGYKTRRIRASLHEPSAFRGSEYREIRTAIAVKITVYGQIAINAELVDGYATVTAVKREPRPLAWPEEGSIGESISIEIGTC